MFSSLLHCLNKRAQALGSPIGWDWVLSDPFVGCFGPALHLMEDAGLLQLSETTRQSSRQAYLSIAAVLMKREHHLRLLLNRFEEKDIAVIPLKGAALLESIYQKIGLRWMGDVDILVKQERFMDAAQILLDEGFEWLSSYDGGDPFKFKDLPRHLWPGELSFQSQRGLVIDLHRSFITYHWFQTPFPVDMEAVWSRAVKSQDCDSKEGQPLWRITLSPYDMLAHMCLHLALHGMQVMKNLWDLDLYLRNLPENWDWEVYINTVEPWGLKSASYHAFLFCQDLFETPVPDAVIAALEPGSFERWQVRRLITPQALLSDKTFLGRRYPTLVKFALFDNPKVKRAAITRLVFPDRNLYKYDPERRNILDHWVHVLDVLLRGN